MIVVGGKGRVASGATAMCESLGAEVDTWDHQFTAKKSILALTPLLLPISCAIFM